MVAITEQQNDYYCRRELNLSLKCLDQNLHRAVMLFHLFVQHVIHEQLTTKLAEQMVLLSKSPLSALVAALSLVCLVINRHKNKKKTQIYGLNSGLETLV